MGHVATLHAAGVLHADIKPRNVLLRQPAGGGPGPELNPAPGQLPKPDPEAPCGSARDRVAASAGDGDQVLTQASRAGARPAVSDVAVLCDLDAAKVQLPARVLVVLQRYQGSAGVVPGQC